ncbi:MAG: hypothetical protein U1F77_18950 [Kiritimatiellia bacterium]
MKTTNYGHFGKISDADLYVGNHRVSRFLRKARKQSGSTGSASTPPGPPFLPPVAPSRLQRGLRTRFLAGVLGGRGANWEMDAPGWSD